MPNDSTIQLNISLQRSPTSTATFALNVDATLPLQGISVIFGASGSGKTTLLRCIAGLEKQVQGEICVGGQPWLSATQHLAPEQRKVGYVAQDGLLFPHLSVEKNIHFGRQRHPQGLPDAQLTALIKLLNIEHCMSQYPASLSGGEIQRVAIARAVATKPTLLLMDEPLSALDVQRKQDIMQYLLHINEQLHIPIIYITHALDEVIKLAQHLLILDQGQLIASGPFEQVSGYLFNPQATHSDSTHTRLCVLTGQVINIDHTWQLADVQLTTSVQLTTKHTQSTQHILKLPLTSLMGKPQGSAVRLTIDASDVTLSLHQQQHSSALNQIPVHIVHIEEAHSAYGALITLSLHANPHANTDENNPTSSINPSDLTHTESTEDHVNQYLYAEISRYSLATLKLTQGQTLWAVIKGLSVK